MRLYKLLTLLSLLSQYQLFYVRKVFQWIFSTYLSISKVMMMATEFEGRLVKCDFADLQPMKAEGMPFNINHG